MSHEVGFLWGFHSAFDLVKFLFKSSEVGMTCIFTVKVSYYYTTDVILAHLSSVRYNSYISFWILQIKPRIVLKSDNMGPMPNLNKNTKVLI